MFEARRRDDKYDLRLFPLWKVLNFHRLRRAARTKSKYDLCRQLVEKKSKYVDLSRQPT